MIDKYQRPIDYLRVSVTDLCNLRCRYCIPQTGVSKQDHRDILSYDEIIAITRAAVGLGIRKVRVTGGEPLVRRGLAELCRGIKDIPGLGELALTTNGLLLGDMAQPLKTAGVDRVNISIDTLRPDRYAHITRGGKLEQALEGIQAAGRAGLRPIKLNVVLIGGFNDDEIKDFVRLTQDHPYEVRFIELMPIGEGLSLWREGFLPNTTVLGAVPDLTPIPDGSGGVAKLYRLPGGKGQVGLINPVSCHFCASCNRLRLTADGMLKPCLHSDTEIPVRGLKDRALKEAIEYAISLKPQSRGDDLSDTRPSAADRCMNQIGG